MKCSVFLLFLSLTLVVNVQAKKKSFPATVHLTSGEIIKTNISLPKTSSSKKISIKNALSGVEQTMESNSIDYFTLEVGTSQYEFKRASLSIPISKKRSINYKKKRWFVRLNNAGGDKIGMYSFANQFRINKKERLYITTNETLYCMSKRSEKICIGVYQSPGGFSGTLSTTPDFLLFGTKKFKLKVANKYLSDQPAVAEKLQQEKMTWEEICSYYQSLVE